MLPPGASWSRVCRRGTALTLVDVEGGANVSALLYRADDPLERYCMPDTLKAQHVSRLTTGVALHSDMGRVLASIVEDTCGWHDTITGHALAAHVSAWGEASYQEHRNDWRRSARDAFLVELAKHGLGRRDLVANINFFSKVAIGNDGELDCLVVLCNAPHPLSDSWSPPPVELLLGDAEDDNVARLACPENERGFAATEAALA
jgi:urea carboxylase-associated protein 2